MNDCKKAPWPKTVTICTLPTAVPACPPMNWEGYAVKEEGTTPMRYNDNYASASATVQAPKSDIAVQRDYLLSQLTTAFHPKEREFQTTFNLYVDNTPKTYIDMIAAIKDGKYTIDPKAEKRVADWEEDEEDGPSYFGPLYGIVWDGPVADRKGYDQAVKDLRKQKTEAERIIVTGDAAAGLAALQAFEAWQPTVATATVN
jgi:hypothetical protein